MNSLKFFLSVGALFAAALVFSQPPPPPSSPPGVPIDGGLGILLAGGIAYGIKRIRDMKRN